MLRDVAFIAFNIKGVALYMAIENKCPFLRNGLYKAENICVGLKLEST
jgi:hypothetical protein